MNEPQRTCLALFHAFGPGGRIGPQIRRVRIVSPLPSGGVLAEPMDRPDRFHVLPPERVFPNGSTAETAAFDP